MASERLNRETREGIPRTIDNIVDVSRGSTKIRFPNKYRQYRIDELIEPFS